MIERLIPTSLIIRDENQAAALTVSAPKGGIARYRVAPSAIIADPDAERSGLTRVKLEPDDYKLLLNVPSN